MKRTRPVVVAVLIFMGLYMFLYKDFKISNDSFLSVSKDSFLSGSKDGYLNNVKTLFLSESKTLIPKDEMTREENVLKNTNNTEENIFKAANPKYGLPNCPRKNNNFNLPNWSRLKKMEKEKSIKKEVSFSSRKIWISLSVCWSSNTQMHHKAVRKKRRFFSGSSFIVLLKNILFKLRNSDI